MTGSEVENVMNLLPSQAKIKQEVTIATRAITLDRRTRPASDPSHRGWKVAAGGLARLPEIESWPFKTRDLVSSLSLLHTSEPICKVE